MWDTYLSEALGEPGEASFLTLHVYVCAAFLTHFAQELLTKDFQEMMLMVQDLPTASWSSQDMEELLSRAFVMKTQYSQSPAHLAST